MVFSWLGIFFYYIPIIASSNIKYRLIYCDPVHARYPIYLHREFVNELQQKLFFVAPKLFFPNPDKADNFLVVTEAYENFLEAIKYYSIKFIWLGSRYKDILEFPSSKLCYSLYFHLLSQNLWVFMFCQLFCYNINIPKNSKWPRSIN